MFHLAAYILFLLSRLKYNMCITPISKRNQADARHNIAKSQKYIKGKK